MKIYEETKVIYPPTNIQVTIYETTDGQKFEIQEEAEKHELKIGVTSLKLNNLLPEDLSVHYVNSINEIKSLTDEEIRNVEVIEDITFPCWIGINRVSFYGYGDDYYLYDLSKLKEDMDNTYQSYQNISDKIGS